MGFWDTITDLVEAAAPWGTADAEAPAKELVCSLLSNASLSLSASLALLACCPTHSYLAWGLLQPFTFDELMDSY